ncbi:MULTISPECIES: acyltransferase family protein [Novosphingobium]|uniref:acyltransferase family protein n=1 Tax=Novosphingobium TaxID=165696 RepID=UPI001CD647EC|nr:acyltransferase family protein [Novosphingobium percolationis]
MTATPSAAGLRYRPEIDGLRALAVLPVILFHAGFEAFGGGFVGVDVFFAISGYLITSLLIADLRHDRLSIAAFYERRARRILPALFVVIAACIPFAWAWLLPSQLADFGKSMIAVALFASNVLFWREQGYFAADTALKPLLHTWSLAVEEQFYILFPLLLWGLWRWSARSGRDGRGLVPVLGALALASLTLSQWSVTHTPNAGFYLAPGRAWELLAGALAALLPASGRASASQLRHLPGLAGLGLIGASALLFSDISPFPGLLALLPVGGAVLVLRHGTADTLAGRLLAHRVPRGIGLISYSAYLWHQPLFAFARAQSPAPPSLIEMGLLSALSLVLGALSWRWVEQPFRRHGIRPLPNRASVFIAALAGMAVLGGSGLVLHRGAGFPGRPAATGTMGQVEQRLAINFGLSPECEYAFSLSPACTTSRRPDTLLWGDSFAMHLAPGLRAGPHPLDLRQHTVSSCAPLMEMGVTGLGRFYDEAELRNCTVFNRQVMAWLRTRPGIRTVVLASPFTMFADLVVRSDGSTAPPSPQIVAAALLRTVAEIRATGARVVVVSPPPTDGSNLGQCLARSLRDGVGRRVDANPCDFPLAKAHHYPNALMRLVSPQVPVIRLDTMLCPHGICETRHGNVILYRDDGHLSIEGSRWLGQRFDWAGQVRAAAR